MPKIELLFFDAGGGHRSAATALQGVCAERYPAWRVELVNVGKMLEPLDFCHRYAGIAGEDIYNKILQHGLTLGAVAMLRATQKIIRWNRKGILRIMGDHWNRSRPDLVVSLIPNFNRPLFAALTAASRETPYMTVMTDIADFPPNFWIEPQPQYLVCGSHRATEQAHALGYHPLQLRQASGMILQPHFYATTTDDRAAKRQALGLQPDLPTALVMFGGHGARVMKDIYDSLQCLRNPVQGIFICGRNEHLANGLRKRKTSIPAHIEGFTRDVPGYMRIADFLIGKPGPGSISEAIHMNLPVIVQRNAWTLPQERYNTKWIQQHDVGIVIPSFRKIGQAVDQMLEADQLARLKANARTICNRAVYEVPAFMEEILGLGPAADHLPPDILSRFTA